MVDNLTNNWDSSKNHFVYGILKTGGDTDTFIRKSRLPFPGTDKLVTNMVEYWDFQNDRWQIDNYLQKLLDKNEFTVYDDEKAFFRALESAKSGHNRETANSQIDEPKNDM